MKKKYILFIDQQYGDKYFASSVKELKDYYGFTGKVSKVYTDDREGNTYHTGYAIGKRWFSVWLPLLKKEG